MSDWPETSESLIQRARGGSNQSAWSELVAVYQPVVYRMARRGGLSHESAEDVIQAVFLSQLARTGCPERRAQCPHPRPA
jgi:RNA polymerase sigma-70 factor, ECF subfamily